MKEVVAKNAGALEKRARSEAGLGGRQQEWVW